MLNASILPHPAFRIRYWSFSVSSVPPWFVILSASLVALKKRYAFRGADHVPPADFSAAGIQCGDFLASAEKSPHSHHDLARRPISLLPGKAASRVFRPTQRGNSHTTLKLDFVGSPLHLARHKGEPAKSGKTIIQFEYVRRRKIGLQKHRSTPERIQKTKGGPQGPPRASPATVPRDYFLSFFSFLSFVPPPQPQQEPFAIGHHLLSVASPIPRGRMDIAPIIRMRAAMARDRGRAARQNRGRILAAKSPSHEDAQSPSTKSEVRNSKQIRNRQKHEIRNPGGARIVFWGWGN
jgi:hypothetical protein